MYAQMHLYVYTCLYMYVYVFVCVHSNRVVPLEMPLQTCFRLTASAITSQLLGSRPDLRIGSGTPCGSARAPLEYHRKTRNKNNPCLCTPRNAVLDPSLVLGGGRLQGRTALKQTMSQTVAFTTPNPGQAT